MATTLPQEQPATSPLEVKGLAGGPAMDPITRTLTFEVELSRWPTETERRYLALDTGGPHSSIDVETSMPISNETPHLKVSVDDAADMESAVRTLKKLVEDASTRGRETDASASSDLEAIRRRLQDLLSQE